MLFRLQDLWPFRCVSKVTSSVCALASHLGRDNYVTSRFLDNGFRRRTLSRGALVLFVKQKDNTMWARMDFCELKNVM
ncbi:hypothetical protein HanRHA438_Chr10g0469401 [Helianthus annuus]|nr:hypothetical protein HanRHA438_Chr10g0469401 [Helianthus annuus]